MINKLSDKLIIKIFNNLDHEGLMKMYNIDVYKDIIKNLTQEVENLKNPESIQ
jgi:hypothetical protein